MKLIVHQFTWERGRGKPDGMEVRLDRALTTQSWLNMFPMEKLYNLEGSNSNHIPIFLIPQKGEIHRGPRRFCFENAWLLEPMCQFLVDDCWREKEEFDIQTKVNSYSDKLAVWGKEITGNFRDNIKECKAVLKRLPSKKDPQSIAEFEAARKRLHLILDQKEIFW